jgi:hypothetical protein
MPTNGIMKEIWALLAQDRSTTEVIALGFKPPTVYKAQRLLRQAHQILYANGPDHIAGPSEEVVDWREQITAEQKTRAEAEARSTRHAGEATRLKEENQLLRQRMENLAQDLSQEVWKLVEPLKAELEELRSVHSSRSPSKSRPVRVVRERSIVVGPRPPFDDTWPQLNRLHQSSASASNS